MLNLLKKIINFIKGLYIKNPVVFKIVSVLLFFAVIGLTYVSVEMTSTPSFCVSCHEMKQAEVSWKESEHYNVPADKKRATCRDCHLPPWSKPVELLLSKAFHGAKDVTKHFTDKEEMQYPGYYFKMKAHAGKSIHNSSCLACHSDIYEKKYEEYENIHTSLKKNKNMKCSSCHEGIAHKEYLPEDMR